MQGGGCHPLLCPGLRDLAGPPVFPWAHVCTSSVVFSFLCLEVGHAPCPLHESGQAHVSLVTSKMVGVMLGTAEKVRFGQKR